MPRTNILKFLLFLYWTCSPAVSLDNGQITYEKFCYQDESCGPNSIDWEGACRTGLQQSPINLPSERHRHRNARRVELEFNDRYCNDEFWIVDNGHTIQVTLEAEPRSSAVMYGYDRYPYVFAQVHFHWGHDSTTGSEHSIDDEFYSMEAHLVHYDYKYDNFTEAANSGDRKALAVIAVFITEGHDDWHRNSGFETIAANIPKFGPMPTHMQQRIDLSTFLPDEGQRFYRYFGSLTTPDCNEVVEWTVLRDPIYVRPSLIEKFRQVGRSNYNRRIGENYRPIQERGQRTVEYLAKK